LKVLIIDDHPLFIDGISLLLKQLSDHLDITCVMSVKQAIIQLESDAEFDIILLDLNLPEMDGVSLLKRFKADELCTPLVIISAEEQAGLIKYTLDWGAMGFIPKSYLADEMLAALRRILQGEVFIPESIQLLLSRLPAAMHSEKLPDSLKKSGISKKQYEVLSLISMGYSNQKIADTLNRTEHTVKSHVTALLHLLGAKNRMECADIARKRGLI